MIDKNNSNTREEALAPKVITLKKGELLFSEGDQSKAMYYLREGQIRVFKKKANSAIEIDTIRAGQIIGELAFLDGNPRSASCEALVDSKLVEISGPTFTQTLQKMPDWVKLLLKTVVGRLRTASTKIKQLEQATIQVDYSVTPEGKKSYIYMSYYDALKVASALLLVGLKQYSEKKELKVLINIDSLHKYAKNIIGIPESKITSFLDVLTQVGLIVVDNESDAPGFYLTDPFQLEKVISFINEQNLAVEEKKKIVNNKSYLIMALIVKNLDQYPAHKETGLSEVNLAQIISVEKQLLQGREPFRIDECEELVKKGFITLPKVSSSENCLTLIQSEQFKKYFQFMKVIKTIDKLNEEKRMHVKAA